MIRTEAKITVSLLFRVRAFFDYHKRCNVHRSEQKNAVVAIRLHREKTKLAARFCGTRRFDFETTDLILKKIPDRRNDGDLCRIAWNNYGHHHDGEGDNESRCEEGKLQRNDCERRRRDADATRRDATRHSVAGFCAKLEIVTEGDVIMQTRQKRTDGRTDGGRIILPPGRTTMAAAAAAA